MVSTGSIVSGLTTTATAGPRARADGQARVRINDPALRSQGICQQTQSNDMSQLEIVSMAEKPRPTGSLISGDSLFGWLRIRPWICCCLGTHHLAKTVCQN